MRAQAWRMLAPWKESQLAIPAPATAALKRPVCATARALAARRLPGVVPLGLHPRLVRVLPAGRAAPVVAPPVGAHEGDAPAVGRPGEPLDAPPRRVEGARLAAVGRQQVEPARAPLGTVGEEGQAAPVRRPGRRVVPVRPMRELPR